MMYSVIYMLYMNAEAMTSSKGPYKLELKRIVTLLSGYPDPNSSQISYG